MALELGQCNLSWYSGSLPGTLYPICGVVTECQTGVTTSALRIHTKTLRVVLTPIREGLSFAQGHRASSVYRTHCIA